MTSTPSRLQLGAVYACATLGLAVAGCGPTYPNCDTDEQCHEGEFCVNGRCEDCRDDSHCPEGQQCDSGACAPIPGWCSSDAMCATDEECVDHRCVPRRVSSSDVETTPGPCQLEPAHFAFDEHTLDATATSVLERDRACLAERGIEAVAIRGAPRSTTWRSASDARVPREITSSGSAWTDGP